MYPIDQIIEESLIAGVFPGASLLVASGREILHEKVYGLAQIEPSRRPLTADTLFDISSLTKPLATATLFMLAVQEKNLDLETAASHFLPQIKPSYTLRQLMNHTSGLPDWKPYYKKFSPPHPSPLPKGERENNKERLVDLIISEPVESPHGTQVVYSDLGYILLGVILEKIFGDSLDQIFKKKVAKPLGMKNTFFSLNPPPPPFFKGGSYEFPPFEKGGKGGFVFAATENCAWRKKMICGEVMDEHVWLMGGVAGHAGLFSTARDIHRWLVEMDSARQGKSSLVTKKTFDLFCKIPKNRDLNKPFHTLGFDTPSLPSSSGTHFSPNSLGHLGYSGCSFWWDLEKNLMAIFLTNRVHPTRKNNRIKDFRPKLHDAIMKLYG